MKYIRHSIQTYVYNYCSTECITKGKSTKMSLYLLQYTQEFPNMVLLMRTYGSILLYTLHIHYLFPKGGIKSGKLTAIGRKKEGRTCSVCICLSNCILYNRQGQQQYLENIFHDRSTA